MAMRFTSQGNAAGLLDVAYDAVEPIWKKRIVLDVWPRHEIRKQISLALIEDLVEDNVQQDVLQMRFERF
jgi:hypothetical protein